MFQTSLKNTKTSTLSMRNHRAESAATGARTVVANDLAASEIPGNNLRTGAILSARNWNLRPHRRPQRKLRFRNQLLQTKRRPRTARTPSPLRPRRAVILTGEAKAKAFEVETGGTGAHGVK